MNKNVKNLILKKLILFEKKQEFWELLYNFSQLTHRVFKNTDHKKFSLEFFIKLFHSFIS